MGNDPSRRQPAVNWNVVGRTRSRRKKSIQMLTIFIDSSTGNWQYSRRFFTASHFNNFFRRNKRPCRRNNSRLFVPKYEKRGQTFGWADYRWHRAAYQALARCASPYGSQCFASFFFGREELTGCKYCRCDRIRPGCWMRSFIKWSNLFLRVGCWFAAGWRAPSIKGSKPIDVTRPSWLSRNSWSPSLAVDWPIMSTPFD